MEKQYDITNYECNCDKSDYIFKIRLLKKRQSMLNLEEKKGVPYEQ